LLILYIATHTFLKSTCSFKILENGVEKWLTK
jgi:hypothetical protein